MEGDPEVRSLAGDSRTCRITIRRTDRPQGYLRRHAERLGAAWDEALAADRPVVIEVKTDPNMPPLPPHITLAQAKHFTSTLIRAIRTKATCIVETAKQVLEQRPSRP